MNVTIRAPETEQEWQQYYQCRWEILRAPWQQPPGSEKDELEDMAVHRLAIIENQIIGVGRLHVINPELAQIRYMAITDNWQHKGIGKKVLQSLEQAAREQGIATIQLNARDTAVPFYLKFDYRVCGPAETLFGNIKHSQMKKNLP